MTRDGVKADPEKVQAVTDMPTPINATELQRMLGMVTYLGRYIPNMSARTAPLRSPHGKESKGNGMPRANGLAWHQRDAIEASDIAVLRRD